MNPDLKAKVVELLCPYHPLHIGIFGSYARGENLPGSDLDILISFSERIRLFKLVQIELELSDKLGIPIHLVTVNSIKNPRLKSHILRDLSRFTDEKGRSALSGSYPLTLQGKARKFEIMKSATFNIELDFDQVIDLVKQLPKKYKIRLSKELEREIVAVILTSLLKAFKTDELDQTTIAREAELVRTAYYASSKAR